MNLHAKSAIETVIRGYETLSDRVTQILSKYADGMAKAKREAAAYKNEDEHISKARERLLPEARDGLASVAASFASVTRKTADDMRAQLRKALAETPPSGVLENLQLYNGLGVVPTRTEAEALLESNGGNLLGLRGLASLLTRTKAPFRLDYSDPAALEKDIALLERLADSADHYAPSDLHTVACDVFRGDHITRKAANGREYSSGEVWDSIALIGRRADVESAVKRLPEIRDRWAADVSTRLVDDVSAEMIRQQEAEAEMLAQARGEEYKPEEIPQSQTRIVEDAATRAVEIAREAGRRDAVYEDVIGRFAK